MPINSEDLRNNLLNRNLYSINNEYPINNDSVIKNVLDTISLINKIVAPFKGYDLSSSPYANLLDYDNQTPITQIGLNMLGKQIALNEISHIQQQYLPIINVNNLIDGNKETNLFTPNKDMKLTKSDLTFTDVLNKLSFSSFYVEDPLPTVQLGKYTYNKNNVLEDSIGEGQTRERLNNINRNKNGLYYDEYPYDNNSLVLGVTDKKDNDNITLSNEGWLSDNSEFSSELSKNSNKIVWGRDGFTGDNTDVRGSYNKDTTKTDNLNEFNVYQEGILYHTQQLINNSNGNIGDITRKAFLKDKQVIGFNGSGLWNSNNSNYAQKSGTADVTGVRQHTVLDQYNNFAKAIRFQGNYVYGGNENSVINKTVIPRFHPTIDAKSPTGYNTKNLMFSIENLAVKVNNDGIIDDEYGTQIPKSEVGPLNGRLMWFPPYGIEIQENSAARFESTVMMGRNEPMYNYMNSERSATLSFTLLTDHPQQLKNYENSVNSQREISDFFAFGGNNYDLKKVKSNIQLGIEQLESERDKIKLVNKNQYIINEIPSKSVKFYFPNDVPYLPSNINTVIDDIYKNNMYEIDNKFYNNINNQDGELNNNIFFKELNGIEKVLTDNAKQLLLLIQYNNYITEEEKNLQKGIIYNDESSYEYKILESHISQYDAIDVINTHDDKTNTLNNILKKVFSNTDNFKYYNIKLTGAASKVGNDNKALAQRRIDSIKILIESRLQKMFGSDAKPIFEEVNNSDSNASSSSLNPNANQYDDNIKRERYVEIKIERNKTSETFDEYNFESNNDKIKYETLTKQIEYLETQLKNKDIDDGIFNEINKDDGIQHGFDSIKNNKFYNGFHTQTPEDLHKRLTFLHQCTRQGSAIHYNSMIADSKLKSKNSVFGRQPICVLRIGDFFYTKVIVESVQFDYVDAPWDLNPEGFGVQPMLAKITMNMKVIGGQSLSGPVSALQNAVSYNYYANSTFTNKGIYQLPSAMADYEYNKGSDTIKAFVNRNNKFKADLLTNRK
jgi:hypothetical protein